jgi:uroporphyrinogen III methyltransferase/synthase
MELLRSCDTVIYDRLSGVLSEEVGPDCEKIYAGKRAGHHSISQEEINALLLEKAREGKRVVRLKGGDPFVFGRGGEEAEFLLQHQIPFTVVPGVTSAVAVPEMAGIPVTHREMSRSFHVITAHTAEQDREKIKCYLREQIESLGKAEGTFIFLMGLQYVEMICELLIESGRPPKLPAALISNGTRYREKVIRGTLADIGARIRAENPPSPAVFLAGDGGTFFAGKCIPAFTGNANRDNRDRRDDRAAGNAASGSGGGSAVCTETLSERGGKSGQILFQTGTGQL